MSKSRSKFKNITVCIMIFLLVINTNISLFAKSTIDINIDKLNKGVVGVSCNVNPKQRMKVIIQKGQSKYTYDINNGYQQFPLQMGNGSYTITCYKNVGGKSYAMVQQKKVDINLKNNEVVYLNSIQPIEWEINDVPIKFASNLTEGITKEYTQITNLYKHMVETGYAYDTDKISRIPTTYIPDIEDTYKNKSGICYDFSSLYGAMLRSQGIPTKLVKGYAKGIEEYHAWNEVYDSATKKWLVVDTTYDIEYNKVKIKVSMVKKNSDYQKVKEY